MKKILLLAFAIVAMTGCTKTQPVNEELPDKRIVATTNVIASKALVENVSEFDLQYVRDDSDPQTWINAPIGAKRKADGKIDFNENYKKDNSNSYFKFFSDGGTAADKKISWTVNGTKDIVYNKATWNAGNYNNPVIDGLAFDHMLTRIEVILQGKDGEDINAIKGSWGNITEIKIAELPSTITYDYAVATDAITYGTPLETGGALPLLAGTTYQNTFTPIAIGEYNNITVAGGIMLPSGASINKVTLLITTAKVANKSVEVTFTNAIEAGKINTITLTFSAADKEVGVTSTVTAWAAGQAGSGTL